MVSDASTLCNFCARFSDVIPRSIIKRQLFLKAYLRFVVTCVVVMKTLKFVIFHIIIAFNVISYLIYPLILYTL